MCTNTIAYRKGYSMWRVIAADDELYIREVLQKLVPWQKLNCELCFVAQNGEELLEKMEECPADIVLTDIKMPVMDGLQLAKQLYETYPETQIIILSAYEDFSYAKTAIKYSVCEYVLKISILEDLQQAVEKAIHNLEKQILDCKAEENPSLIHQMEQFVEEHLYTNFTLDDMAEALHANRSYLSRLYKNKKGNNLFAYVMQKRIEKSKQLILQNHFKIYEIAEQVGFEDTAYFSKVFKKFTGCSPREYKA